MRFFSGKAQFWNDKNSISSRLTSLLTIMDATLALLWRRIGKIVPQSAARPRAVNIGHTRVQIQAMFQRNVISKTRNATSLQEKSF